jgi:hypothetical protein
MASQAKVGKQDSCASAIIFCIWLYSPVVHRNMQRFAVLQHYAPALRGGHVHISLPRVQACQGG